MKKAILGAAVVAGALGLFAGQAQAAGLSGLSANPNPVTAGSAVTMEATCSVPNEAAGVYVEFLLGATSINPDLVDEQAGETERALVVSGSLTAPTDPGVYDAVFFCSWQVGEESASDTQSVQVTVEAGQDTTVPDTTVPDTTPDTTPGTAAPGGSTSGGSTSGGSTSGGSTSGGSTSDELPSTGSNNSVLAVVGVATVAAGALSMRASRRRGTV